MATQITLTFITLFSFLSISTPTPTLNILNDAVNILSDSGYNSMALILEFGSRSIAVPPTTSLTIFSSDGDVFSESGQHSLNFLQFQLSPLSFSLHSLKSLSPDSKIATLWANHSLIVTSDGNEIGVNGVKLDPNFHNILGNCPAGDRDGDHSFEEASKVLTSQGYSVMASFLDLQLAEFKDQMGFLTIFAPIDESLMGFLGNFSEHKSNFLRHLVPCKIPMVDLASIQSDGVLLHTYLDGFSVNVTTDDGDTVIVNGVEVIAPELYNNSWLVVHGLGGSLHPEELDSSSSDYRSSCADAMGPDFMFFLPFAYLVLLIFFFGDSLIGWFAFFLLFLVSLCWAKYQRALNL